MKKLFLILIVFQLSIFSLQAQTSAEEKEQLKKVNQDLVVNYKAGKLDNALSSAQKAVELCQKIFGADSLETATAYKNLGIIYRAKKKYKEAITNLQKAVEIYRVKSDQNAKAIAQTLDELALAFALDGDSKRAEIIYTEALATAEKAYGKESKGILPFLKSMTEVYILVKKYDEAQAMFVRQYLTTRKYFQLNGEEIQQILDSFYCFNSQYFKPEETAEKEKKFFDAIRGEKTPTENTVGNKTVSGGVVNGKAKYLATPAYPSSARSRYAQGTIPVRVMINEEGEVTSAKAICGDLELGAAGEAAARQSKFNPTLLDGKAVKVIGIIIYNFIP